MYKSYIKRIFDFVFVLIIAPFVIIIIGVSALVIKIEDRGPVFYLAKRLGRDGIIFEMYKLRTMRVNAPDIRNEDGSTYNSDKDSRLTKVGGILRKISFDELPQIINVYKGEMSFIGPRPDLPEHIMLYEGKEIEKLKVLPGISGYNQAYFRNSIEWKQRIQNDIFYINNLSLWLDVKIFIKTIIGIILKERVYIKIAKAGGIEIHG